MVPPALFFLGVALTMWGLCGSIQILGVFSCFCEKCHWNFDRACTELIDGFNMDIFNKINSSQWGKYCLFSK